MVNGSIVRQMLFSAHDITEGFHATGATHDSVDMDYMLVLLSYFRTRTDQQRVYIVIGGLDLCEDADKGDFSNFLQKLHDAFGVLVCAFYYQEPNLSSKEDGQTSF
jgi:hypothetical protein